MFKTIPLFIVIIVFLSGCGPFSSAVMKRENYNEEIKGFVLLDNNRILAVSNKYNYIFDISNELKSILTSPYRKDLNLKATLSSFIIKNYINIEGSYEIVYKSDKYLSNELENWFYNNGFERTTKNFLPKGGNGITFQKNYVYKKKEKLKGKRYLLDKRFEEHKFSKFNKDYKHIRVIYDGAYVNDEKVRKYLEPVATVVDVTLITTSFIVVFGPIIPIGIPAIISNQFPREIKGERVESLYDKYNVKSKYELK